MQQAANRSPGWSVLTAVISISIMTPLFGVVTRGGPPTQAPRQNSLQAALDDWAKEPAHHGVSASVIFADGAQWSGAAGVEDTNAPIRPDHLFWLASITKTMTGAVILQLAQESRLSLGDSVGRWLDSGSNINPRIAVRQLMNHTSGVPSYDGAIIRAKNDRSYVFSADELLATVGPPLFEPGARMQ